MIVKNESRIFLFLVFCMNWFDNKLILYKFCEFLKYIWLDVLIFFGNGLEECNSMCIYGCVFNSWLKLFNNGVKNVFFFLKICCVVFVN